jgi:hypothetical protein
MSEKYSLNKTDLIAIAKGAGLAVGGVVVTYLIELIPNVDFGANGELVAAVLAVILNFARKFLEGKNES